MIKTVLFAAAALLATAATAAPVLAKDVVVNYGDLDLATAQGQRSFSHRIDRAAKSACDFDNNVRIQHTETMRCVKKARTDAKTAMASLVDDVRLGG